MYIYYDSTNGKIMHGIEAKKPLDNPPNNGGTILYLDDEQYSQLYNNGNIDLTNWTIQNGVPTYTPQTADQLFPGHQSGKLKWLQNELTNKMAAGFVSSADGTERTYGLIGTDSSGMSPMQKWTGILTTIAAGLGKPSYAIKDCDGNSVNLTQAQFKQFCADAFNYINGNEQTMFTKEIQYKACTVQAELDSIAWPNPNPPSVPTGLTATAGTGQAILNWTANSDVTMIGGGYYNVYENGTKINANPVTATTCTATGLTAGTSYNFSITAVDTDGLESAHSASISVTAN